MNRQPSFFISSTHGHGLLTLRSEVIQPMPTLPKVPPLRLRNENSILSNVSDGLFFDEEVIRERCFHMLPYSDKYFCEVIDPSNVVHLPKPHRVSGPMGRINKPGVSSRHMPCIQKPKKKPVVKKTLTKKLDSDPSEIQETKPEMKYEPKKVNSLHKGVSRWDEYVLSIISKNTANWIVTHSVDADDPKKQKLDQLIHDWYGSDVSDELIRDHVSELDGQSEVPDLDQTLERSEWRKRKEQTLLDKVRHQTKSDLPTDPYSEENAATFYRLPAGMRQTQKSHYKEAEGGVNKLAAGIEIVRKPPPPPPTLRDHLPPGVGDKFLDTDNEYEQEMLTGNRQIYQADEHKIIMESDNKYLKQLRREFPQKPENWSTTPRLDPWEPEHVPIREGRIKKGFTRWKALPSLIDESANVIGSQTGPDDLDFLRTNDAANKRRTRSNVSLVKILEEWRSKWFLDSRYSDATNEDLLRDMADSDKAIRLKAVMTLSRALDYSPNENTIVLTHGPEKVENRVPEPLVKGLNVLMNDEEDRVRTAAAITLYALKMPNNEAEKILRDKVVCRNPVDRWASVQCLAHYGICDDKVVGELVDQLMTSEDAVRHEQAIYLLSQLSADYENSGLVYSMLAEHLNSTNWRHKVISCKTLPVLRSSISKDIANKLTYLMWFDWHNEVRKAAARCLGRTGHGKDVHDDLVRRLQDPCETIRADAVSRLGFLGIMTAKLLPVFLTCFNDEHIQIREETCIASGNLMLKADEVIELLVDHASYDPIWRVKALAIQSLGKIGVLNHPVRHCVLWAVRYETEPAVRAEACQAIIKLHLTDDETADILQNRYLVETSPIVKLVIVEALSMLGISPVADMHTVARVKREVRKLCSKDNISTQILLNDRKDERSDNINRFLCPEERKEMIQSEPGGQRAHSVAPLHAERPVSKLDPRASAEGELEAILEYQESVYQSRPMTTSSVLTGLTEDSHSSTEAVSTPHTRSSRKSSGKSSGRLTKSGKRMSRNLDKFLEPKEDHGCLLPSGELTPYATPARTPARSIRGSIFGILPKTAANGQMTTATQKRTPLKFHYIMENIDSFEGMDLSDVIGILTLNNTIGNLSQAPVIKTRKSRGHLKAPKPMQVVESVRGNEAITEEIVTDEMVSELQPENEADSQVANAFEEVTISPEALVNELEPESSN